MLRTLAVILLGSCFVLSAQSVSEADYPLETHQVTTSDGYILELKRIPYGVGAQESAGSSDKKVVYLMHGFSTAYNSFTYLGPEYAIAYTLANAGFDVWMGNARGTRYSRRHVSLDPDKDKYQFFNFSYEEIALYDLPASIDYILSATNRDKLHYIGHSQGGTVFLVLNSMSTAYHAKIASAHLLAGVGYQNNFRNAAVSLLVSNTDTLYATLYAAGVVELRIPVADPLIVDIVNSIINVLFKSPLELLRGGAIRQAIHFFQNFRDKAFRRWNYRLGNFAAYGSLSPPSYDLSKININTTLHYSVADTLVSPKDTIAMAQVMPNARVRKVPDDLFLHVDYVLNPKVKSLVTDYIIEAIKNY